MRFIGQGAPPNEVGLLIQLVCYELLLALLGFNWGGFITFIAILVTTADFLLYRLRFWQGECNLTERWKLCPLIDDQGDVAVIQEKPESILALSYRWQNENVEGFNETNLNTLFGIMKRLRANRAFVDRLCRWEDGRMATLDVNKSVYSTADKHLLYADARKFRAMRIRLRLEFLFFFGCFCSLAVIAFIKVSTSWLVIVLVALAIMAGINHCKNYVSYWMRNVLPGVYRVWLRLEYECRRSHTEKSVLFDQSGAFDKISFKSASDWDSMFLSFLWLLFYVGNPICELPNPGDLSALESRSWAETVTLIDEWTSYKASPNPALRLFENSQVLTLNVVNYPNPSPPEVHLVGGEIVWWWFGRIHKSDGVVSKFSITKYGQLWFQIDDTKIS